MSAATEKRSAKLRISIYVFAIFWLIISAFPSFGLCGEALRLNLTSFYCRLDFCING